MGKTTVASIKLGENNENLTKLRELVEKFSINEKEEELESNRFKAILTEIKDVVESEYHDTDSTEKKLRAYERICHRIQIILKRFKL
jgi:uncharacterized UPF0160 family protein